MEAKDRWKMDKIGKARIIKRINKGIESGLIKTVRELM